ncbi:MAG: cob(I)yrinic acid a,c-diamide adenosyltransferase [Eubacterium sp.]|nr:cob(I)yrinic acid a,c-diamide adenosyltransferase [Eubacterium sp.]
MKYCTHVYCGTGKGKTTAAIGLAVRAAGAGCRVLFCQFLKSNITSELSVLETLPQVTILRPEGQYPFTRRMTAEDRTAITAEHNRILERIAAVLCQESSAHSDTDDSGSLPVLVILDELAWAYHYGLLDREQALSLLDSKKAEFVITGRVRVPELIERADYVTNLQEEKHPFRNGIPARKGIEF